MNQSGLGLEIPQPFRSNHLYYGDNLTIMKNIPTGSVDLIYLDPPFNSQRNYNLIYQKLTGQPVPEQEEAFCDAWEMDTEKEEMVRRMPIVFRDYGAGEGLIRFWQAWIGALRDTHPRLLAYLVYMSYRLFEMRRILKDAGSIYLHCDPTASHYIKVIMDGIFGHQIFVARSFGGVLVLMVVLDDGGRYMTPCCSIPRMRSIPGIELIKTMMRTTSISSTGIQTMVANIALSL